MKKLIPIIASIIPCFAFAASGNDTISSKINSTFSFELKSNPTTGYGWMVKKIPNNVVLLGMEYEQSKDCDGNLGCGGVEKFFFKAIKIGNGKIELKYGPSFENLPKESTYKYIKVTK